jgi:uncharacterized protein YraI
MLPISANASIIMSAKPPIQWMPVRPKKFRTINLGATFMMLLEVCAIHKLEKFKNSIFLTLVVAVFFVAMSSNVLKAEEWAAAATSVNIRGGPGTNYEIVGNLPAGEIVSVLSCNSGYEWCEIDYVGQRGYVAARYLTYAVQGDYYDRPVSSVGVYVGLPLFWDVYPTYRPWGPSYRPPGYRPPGNRPPGYRPPGSRPPGYRPPDNLPPGFRPPVNRPPGYQPPDNLPPGFRPPVNRPPGYLPPDNRPPGYRPPGNRPPGFRPPVNRPPGYRPPENLPPGFRPPVNRPPGYLRPTSRPPGFRPPGGGRPSFGGRPGGGFGGRPSFGGRPGGGFGGRRR